MNMLLLKKVEGLTLYAIAMNTKMEEMKKQNKEQLEECKKRSYNLKK